jgi:tripartite-type tricarboxylate transporter receptor subunit TctC
MAHATRRTSTRRRGASLAGGLALALVAAACGNGGGGEDAAAGEEGFDLDRVRWIVPSEAGGGFDTSTRQFEPHYARELGAQMPVENLPGGNFAVGTSVLVREGGECEAIGTIGVPHVLFSFLTQDVDYDYEDLAPIARLTDEPGMIRVRDDAPWETLEDLVEDAAANPGEIRLSVSGYTSSNYLGVLEIEEETGAEFNVVPYDGGSPARTALVSGEVDVTHAGVFNSLAVEDETRVLAVHQESNDWPDLTDDAPTVNDALGADLAENGSSYGIFATAECRDEFPERYEALVEAFHAAADSEEFQQDLEEVGELDKLIVVEADEYDQAIRDEMETLDELIDQHEELQEVDDG